MLHHLASWAVRCPTSSSASFLILDLRRVAGWLPLLSGRGDVVKIGPWTTGCSRSGLKRLILPAITLGLSYPR